MLVFIIIFESSVSLWVLRIQLDDANKMLPMVSGILLGVLMCCYY